MTSAIQLIINASNSAELFAIIAGLRDDCCPPPQVDIVIPGPKLVVPKPVLAAALAHTDDTLVVKNAAPVEKKPAPAPKPVAAAVVPEVIIPEKAITLEGIQESLKKVSPGQLDKLRVILADFAAKRLSDVAADKLAAFWARCQKEVLA